jgi:phage-related protein
MQVGTSVGTLTRSYRNNDAGHAGWIPRDKRDRRTDMEGAMRCSALADARPSRTVNTLDGSESSRWLAQSATASVENTSRGFRTLCCCKS